MKENKKKKTISKVLDFEKKIHEAKDKLDSLEERKKAIVAASVVDELSANGMSLSDFYDMVENRNKSARHKPFEKTEATNNDTTNGGTNQ